MTKEEILAGLKEIIADRLGSDVSNVDMKTTLQRIYKQIL